MGDTSLRYSTFPRTEPPPRFAAELVEVFRIHRGDIDTHHLKKGLTSDEVLAILRKDLVSLGFEVEASKRKRDKIERPVFFGENGMPTVRYEIDAYHPHWRCGLEVEAGRAWMGNAVYRDLIQAMVMVEVDWLALAVPNAYKYQSGAKQSTSKDYLNACGVADALFGHSRVTMPYRLIVVGY
jgi:hypothetical protein